MALLDLNDLEVAMNRSLTDGQAAQAQYYIDLISALIEGYTGISFTVKTGQTLRARADAYGTINIDFEPVNGVTSVTDYQTGIVLTSWRYDGMDCIYGLYPFEVVDIVFDYGLATPPVDIVAVATEATKRAYRSYDLAGGPLKQHAVGDVIDIYDTARASAELGNYFTAAEVTILDLYTETNRTLHLGAESRSYYGVYQPYLNSNLPEPFWW